MRRVPAILLVFLFSFSLIGPALFVRRRIEPARLLPQRWQTSLRHARKPDMAEAPSSGVTVGALRVKCPFFPNGGAVVPECGPALLAAPQTAGVPAVSQIADRARTEDGYRISLSRSHHKRGPPTLLS